MRTTRDARHTHTRTRVVEDERVIPSLAHSRRVVGHVQAATPAGNDRTANSHLGREKQAQRATDSTRQDTVTERRKKMIVELSCFWKKMCVYVNTRARAFLGLGAARPLGLTSQFSAEPVRGVNRAASSASALSVWTIPCS